MFLSQPERFLRSEGSSRGPPPVPSYRVFGSGTGGMVGSVPCFEDGTNPFLCLVVWVEFILFFVWLEGLEKRDGVQL